MWTAIGSGRIKEAMYIDATMVIAVVTAMA
jgi:hypothetical protein